MRYFIFAFVMIVAVIFLWNVSNFRKPTGKYGIGIVSYHWVDADRKETLGEQKDAPRELMVYFYYPTDQKNEQPTKLYDADALQSEKDFVAAKSKIPARLFAGWNGIKTYAQDHAQLSQEFEKYPVIIIPHGGGTMVQHYTWMLEELASQGYIVVGINHPYMAAVTRFPDGRVIKSLVQTTKDPQVLTAWKQQQLEVCVADIEFVMKKLQEINQSNELFAEKLDVDHVVVAGHSFGGHLALIVGARNPELKAVVDIDGGQRAFPYIVGKPFPVPCLVMLAEKSRQWRGERAMQDRKIIDQFCEDNKQNVEQVVTKNIGHGALTDLPILMHSTLFSRWLSHFIDIDCDCSSTVGCHGIDLAATYLVEFLDTYLKNKELK